MKLLFENWRKYLSEGNNMIVTFDFDDTLTITRPDEDWGVVEVGPNMETINNMKEFIASGAQVYIVTSRFKSSSAQAYEGPQRSTPEQYVEEFGLQLAADPIYTNGKLKAQTLLGLGSQLHFDDDPEELDACEEVGIKTKKIAVPYWDVAGINEQYDLFIKGKLDERQFIKKAIRYLYKDE